MLSMPKPDAASPACSRSTVPPELGYGKLQVQEIPPVRASLRRVSTAHARVARGALSVSALLLVADVRVTCCAQNATLYFDIELLSIKKENPFGKAT